MLGRVKLPGYNNKGILSTSLTLSISGVSERVPVYGSISIGIPTLGPEVRESTKVQQCVTMETKSYYCRGRNWTWSNIYWVGKSLCTTSKETPLRSYRTTSLSVDLRFSPSSEYDEERFSLSYQTCLNVPLAKEKFQKQNIFICGKPSSDHISINLTELI